MGARGDCQLLAVAPEDSVLAAVRSTRRGAGTKVLRTGGALVSVGFAACMAAPAFAADSPDARPESKERSWADLASNPVDQTADLAGVPTAASRAKLRTPLDLTPCTPASGAADGSRVTQRANIVYYPLEEGTYFISSSFGWRGSPITGQYQFHLGLDFAATLGTPIYAVADGVVTYAQLHETSGYKTIIEHVDENGDAFETTYHHLSAGSQIALVGDQVKAGQQIASVGNTGNSTGPHLHLEVHSPEGEALDPAAWLSAHQAVFIGEACQ